MSTVLGTTLSGRYRLEARIGAGGMSTVYRAVDETLERPVAVKLMNREVSSDSDLLERFRREARAVAQLSHPNIVGVIDAGDDHDPVSPRPYIVFEYVEGETLKERIRRLARLPIPEAVAYSIEIARALGAAHARHIVHRDVKPQNVLIDDHGGSAKVTDFGIARTLDEEGLTADGRVLGTTDYVSPEQALGQHVTGQSDLYSLGIALYEMLTGEVPFKGENQVAVAMKHVREELPDVRTKRPEVSAALAAVIETATAKRTRDRYANDAELIADLEEALAIETARAGSATGEATAVLQSLPKRTRGRVPYPIRHRVGAVVALLVLVLAIVGVIIFLATRAHHGGTPTAHTPAARVQLVPVKLTFANSYNPFGYNGQTAQNGYQAPNVIDGNTATGWTTDIYDSRAWGKPGVGIYVQAPQAAAEKLTVVTATPGWSGKVFGSNTPPDPTSFPSSHWVQLASTASAAKTQQFELTDSGGAANRTKYDYYLVWITELPPTSLSVTINKVELLAPHR